MPTTLPKQRRKHSDLRDRLFYIGVALTFAALGVGIAAIAPVLSYDCQRDASGVVNCTVHRRIYGLVPLTARTLFHIVSAEVESSSSSDRSGYWRFTKTHDVLILACADGTRWSSINSSAPIGQSSTGQWHPGPIGGQVATEVQCVVGRESAVAGRDGLPRTGDAIGACVAPADSAVTRLGSTRSRWIQEEIQKVNPYFQSEE